MPCNRGEILPRGFNVNRWGLRELVDKWVSDPRTSNARGPRYLVVNEMALW